MVAREVLPKIASVTVIGGLPRHQYDTGRSLLE